jgi:hypothetical protein
VHDALSGHRDEKISVRQTRKNLIIPELFTSIQQRWIIPFKKAFRQAIAMI